MKIRWKCCWVCLLINLFQKCIENIVAVAKYRMDFPEILVVEMSLLGTWGY